MNGMPMMNPFDEMESQVGDIVVRTQYEGVEHKDDKIYNIYHTRVIKGPDFMRKEPLKAFGEEAATHKHIALCFLIDRLIHKYKFLWWRWVAWPTVRSWLFFR